ncbi:MAG: MotE family protein [Campylobacterales bacterium]
MKPIFLVLAASIALWAQTDCNRIFEERKQEIVFELDRLDRSKAELKALQEAYSRVLGEKEGSLASKEAEIDRKLAAIEAERATIERLTKRNEEILKQIAEAKDGKVIDLYTNMKASAAGEVMNNMDPYLAATILSQLPPKTAADIIARVEPGNAANITTILQKGPPYSREANATTP